MIGHRDDEAQSPPDRDGAWATYDGCGFVGLHHIRESAETVDETHIWVTGTPDTTTGPAGPTTPTP